MPEVPIRAKFKKLSRKELAELQKRDANALASYSFSQEKSKIIAKSL